MTPDQETKTEARTQQPRGGNPLTNTNFRRLWLTNIGFFIVVNAQRFVFGWLVLDGLLRDAAAQGMVVFALGVPSLFLVLHAGAWADRMDRRVLLIATQGIGALVMLVTGLVVGSGSAGYGFVVAAAVVAGAAAAVGQPVRASLVPALVDRSQLFSAIAMNALAMTSSMILGPVLAQAVGNQFGFAGAFYFQALLLGVGLVFLVRIETPRSPRTERRSVLADTKLAVGHVLADPHLKVLFGLLIVAAFTINPAVMVTLQAFVKDELGRSSDDAAPLFALMGVGIAITSTIVMRKGDMKNKGMLFQRAMMTGTFMTLLMGRTTEYWQLLPLVFVMGLAGGFYINMNQGLVQASTPQEMMGRVMGLYTLVIAGLLPFGAAVLGAIASRAGIGNTITGAAVIGFAIVTVTYFRNRDLRTLG